ncbi:triose-phosphate isomerase [Heliorestis acidaminivorans]|uniref:Triosephosphate isomerase n=1 Tax=Heliorestis acidaminivorans TaxID=553427 RepID=A0A6I0EXW1_9FIRM|nr:triose-phosphate isomerase [Heliorestis acidaminivorans]KAB2952093.1 triose-phosphate isomerase [Heliorestis acidaminivorans]
MRVPVLAGNWKMYMTPTESQSMIDQLIPLIEDLQNRKVVLCPPYTSLSVLSKAIEGSPIQLGAQNMYPVDEGAFTGEVSPKMLQALQCSYVIIGHSERRQYFGETDSSVAEKTLKALQYNLTPIVCVGETLEQREEKLTEPTIEIQIRKGLAPLVAGQFEKVIIAYEPVWAIGTGRTASPEDAQDVCAFIRTIVASIAGDEAQKVPILYGGSVKPENIKELMSQPDIDGALVGGASLKAESFARIVRFEEQ